MSPEGPWDFLLKRDVLICDFCSEPNPSWSHPCRPFRVRVPGLGTIGEARGAWAACETCHRLVLDEDWAGLLRRGKLERHQMGRVVKTLHRLFREHRFGAPVPMSEVHDTMAGIIGIQGPGPGEGQHRRRGVAP